MLESITNIFKIPDLKKKILITGLLLILYRLGSFIPTPGVDASVLQEIFSAPGADRTLFGMFDMFVWLV